MKFVALVLALSFSAVSYAAPAVLSLSVVGHEKEGVYIIGFTSDKKLNLESREWFDLALRDREAGFIHDCSPRLALTLAEIHRRTGSIIRLHSGYRTKPTNDKHTGVDNSHHLDCTAVDISLEDMSQPDLAALALVVLTDLWGDKVGGVGVYDSRVHIDVGARRYWEN